VEREHDSPMATTQQRPPGQAAEEVLPTFSRPRQGPLHHLRRIPNPVFAWLLMVPSLIFLGGFTVFPAISALWNSLQEPGIDGGIGPAYYEQMMGDAVFRRSLFNNLLFSFITVPVSIAVAMLMAVLVNKKLRGRGLLRLAYFTPAMLPVVAAAAIWLFFYQPNFGALNTIARWLGFEGQNWLGNPSTVLPALMVMMIWHQAGLFMLFYLAGLQLISPELDEASQLEGSGRWYHFRRVTFPLLMPTTLFTSIVGLANSFKQVDFIFVMTQGGPNNASNMLLYYIWQTTFPQRRPEYAAAITVVLVLILIVLALIQIRLFERRIHYR
jgi:sn-glycerol 3-phosphate transport system permease protein